MRKLAMTARVGTPAEGPAPRVVVALEEGVGLACWGCLAAWTRGHHGLGVGEVIVWQQDLPQPPLPSTRENGGRGGQASCGKSGDPNTYKGDLLAR